LGELSISFGFMIVEGADLFYGDERGLDAPNLLCMTKITQASFKALTIIVNSGTFRFSSVKS